MKKHLPQLEIGDLVTIAPWCKNKGRFAQVVKACYSQFGRYMIQYMDARGLLEEPSEALRVNLLLEGENPRDPRR
jgi:hypothetical protein